MKIVSANYWRRNFIVIPLLPFIFSFIIKFILFFTSDSMGFTVSNILQCLYHCFEPQVLSFTMTLLAFVVKNEIVNYHLVLHNETNKEEVAEAVLDCLIIGLMNLLLFVLFIVIDTVVKHDLSPGFHLTHFFITVVIFINSFYTIKRSVDFQSFFKLTSNFFI